MRIAVLGAGVIGLTSAYYLNRAGHEVVVVDRHPDVAAEASGGNGGQLSYSYVAPLAGPGVLSKLPGWLARRDSPVRFKPSMNIEQWRWCLQFALACTRARSNQTTRELLSLSFMSRTLMHELRHDEPAFDFDFQHSGKLVLHRDAKAMGDAVDLLGFQRSLGCEQEALSAAECVALEPALADSQARIAGGIYTRSEDTADCQRFCKGLETLLRAAGVQFIMNTRIDALSVSRGGRVAVRGSNGPLEADHFIVATGAGTTRLLKPLDIHAPVHPLKGYSLTYPLGPRSHAPTLSITDFARKIVYARLGNRLRAAGMADLDGYSLTPDPSRVATLRTETAALFPQVAACYPGAVAWTGLRPATPRGKPIIGPTRYRNLWLNVGHGALGFTLAFGSAALLSGWIDGRADPSLSGLFVPPR